jgi:hypothetical protein
MIQTKAHAVLIGVDDYSTYDATNKHNLLGCVNDVRAFWDVCVTSGFAPENIHVLTNPPLDPAEVGGLPENFKPATRANILAEQEALVTLLRTDARAVGLLVYSGHGSWIDNASDDSAVICPSDFWMDLARPNNEIPVHALWKGGGSNLTVVLDCCHSGGRDRLASHPITLRDPHRKHLPMTRAHEHAHAQAPGAIQGDMPSEVVQLKVDSPNQGTPDQTPPPKGVNLEAFKPLHVEDLAAEGLLPIGTAMSLTLTARVLTEHDLKHSPYRHTERGLGGARVLAACDIQEAAYQAEFAGRFHGAFTWALTSTVGQWQVEEAPDGAIRTTIGCGAVKRHVASLLKVFTFKQTPVLHPASAVNLPFFGIGGPISENPTGVIYPDQIDPDVKVLKLALTNDAPMGGAVSVLQIVNAVENWSLGSDFMTFLARASASTHTALNMDITRATITPLGPVTRFQMPTVVDWGTAVHPPAGAAFFSMSGAGVAVVALSFELDMASSPARVTGIHWYQGVTGTTAATYALISPGRDFAFANQLPSGPGGLTWFHAFVRPL